MKRRKKWPYFFLPLLLLLVLPFYKQKNLVDSKPVVLHTWSSFNQMKRLQMLLQGFAIESIIDVPCVEFSHLNPRDLYVSSYRGVVKEREVAQAMQVQFGSALCTFEAFDITRDVLPKSDLILCWDALGTLSTQEIKAALVQFKKSGAKFLLMRHYPEIKENVETEGLRKINWKLPPYNLPEPLIHIMENGEEGMESLALWNLEKLSSSFVY